MIDCSALVDSAGLDGTGQVSRRNVPQSPSCLAVAKTDSACWRRGGCRRVWPVWWMVGNSNKNDGSRVGNRDGGPKGMDG